MEQKKAYTKKSLKRHGIILVVLGVVMLGVAYGFVPLYRTFCQLVGIPIATIGTMSVPKERAVNTVADTATDRVVTVRFIGNANAGVPVTFSPRVRTLKVRIGEDTLTAYDAKNLSLKPVDGIASHTIVAHGGSKRDVAEHITLTQCFCFDEQTYPPQEDVTLPLSFAVEPTLPEGVHTITFGYTLFKLER